MTLKIRYEIFLEQLFKAIFTCAPLFIPARPLYLLVHQNARKINKKIILASLLIAPPIYFLFQLSAPPILVAAADNWCIYIMFIFYSFDSRFYTFVHWTDFVFLFFTIVNVSNRFGSWSRNDDINILKIKLPVVKTCIFRTIHLSLMLILEIENPL